MSSCNHNLGWTNVQNQHFTKLVSPEERMIRGMHLPSHRDLIDAAALERHGEEQ
jgi:hypothetical protein